MDIFGTVQPSVNDDHTCASDIVIQVPGSLLLEGYRVIDFDLETRTAEVELLAVASHAEAESRPAGDLGSLSDVIRPQVKRPRTHTVCCRVRPS